MTAGKLFGESLVEMGEFFKAHPELAIPWVDKMYAFVTTKEELVTVARQLGRCEKGADDNYFYLTKTFGSIQVQWNLSRGKVCRKVVTGKRLVPEQVVAAVPEQVIPAHEEDVYEWHCDEPLLGGTKAEDVVKELEGAGSTVPVTASDIPF